MDYQYAHIEDFMGEDDAWLDDVYYILKDLLLPATRSYGDRTVELPRRLANKLQLQLLHLFRTQLQLFINYDALALNMEDYRCL